MKVLKGNIYSFVNGFPGRAFPVPVINIDSDIFLK